MVRSADSLEVAVSAKWAAAALAAGIAASLLQAMLVPFTAAPQFGLLVNQGDLEIYRNAAGAVLDSHELYTAPIPPGGWFTYPPFAALVFIPLAVVSFGVTKVVWFVMSCAALYATIWRCWRVLGYRGDTRLAVLCLGLGLIAVDIEAVRGSLWQGQINLLLIAVLVWDLTRPPSARLRGFSIGVVTGIKLTAIVFLPYLLLTRQWRATATAIATGLVTAAVAWLILPSDTQDFWRDAAGDVDRIGPVTHPGNQSINGVLSNLWAPQPAPNWLWPACVAGAACLGYAAAVTAHRTDRSLLGMVVVGLIGCAVPPLAWGHHWVWLLPLLIILLHHTARAHRHRILWIATAAVTFAAASMWLTSWLYAEIKALGLTGTPTYVPAMTAAAEQISHQTRAIVCGVPLAVYFAVVVAILTQQPTRQREPDSGAEQPRVRAHS
ncbi:glycosyltransferase 87 family protein [Nocardia asiatica]|uniref:glycosyltransferase 87 family protein n=1 Tax=Nocardia asiatica TaxID=209252 RepID=UPI002456A474|nr:glycosyltransferase 87 family protein [Nocardia asiatica]